MQVNRWRDRSSVDIRLASPRIGIKFVLRTFTMRQPLPIMRIRFLLLVSLLMVGSRGVGQPSVARQWNEVLLEAIRHDFARPTVHARNLFHLSAAMYDAWAAYDPSVAPYFLGRSHRGYSIPFDGVSVPDSVPAAREEAISYACYRLIRSRFLNSPGQAETQAKTDSLMNALGYDPRYTSEDYRNGPPAALGNYLAAQIIEFGWQDGANEGNDYQNIDYQPVNPPLLLTQSGNPDIQDPNRWQPLAFRTFIDQAGNEIPGGMPDFIGAEWGRVVPFSLTATNRTIYQRDDREHWVYYNPGDPCYLDVEGSSETDDYQWNFALVARWSAHLDPNDGVQWDISPASLGNLSREELPASLAGLRDFYRVEAGGDPSPGYTVNPKTNQPYAPQVVARGDYTRVLAEFWADGPNSETPPGHWFTIFNYVTDHPQFERKLQGQGEPVDPLEWDVKGYFTLGGAMHDVAVAVWSIKGYYDYVRPISAVRYMAEQGQSTDPSLPSYDPNGLPLQEGFLELVNASDPLAGADGEHVGKVKVFAWRGPEAIPDANGIAGAGWVLAEDWWPYQRSTFVTPAFAGYVSGHSTFSRAAARVMSLLTGDEYFPGGMSEFVARRNEFLSFEEGPSTDVVLQWAKYTDASDQCSLSRIWGGIHPPVDDIRGRLIGEQIGRQAFDYAQLHFANTVLSTHEEVTTEPITVYPNPVAVGTPLRINVSAEPTPLKVRLRTVQGALVWQTDTPPIEQGEITLDTSSWRTGMYLVSLEGSDYRVVKVMVAE